MIDDKDVNDAMIDVESADDKEQVEAQITSAEREIEAFKKALEEKKAGKVRYENQCVRQSRIRVIQLENFQKLDPTYEYEKVDEYWELQKEELADKVIQEEQVAKGTVKRFDLEIEQIEETIKSNEEKLIRLSNLLGDEE